MTENEAIIKLKEILEEATNDEDSVCYVTSCDKEHLEIAIQAIEKVQKFEAIGTIEELQELKARCNMNAFIEKLIGRLEEYYCENEFETNSGFIEVCIEIVNQLAEEMKGGAK